MPLLRKRRWLTFSLQRMFVAVTAIAVCLGVLAWWMNSARTQRAIIKELFDHDRQVFFLYDFNYAPAGRNEFEHLQTTSNVPQPLLNLLGTDFFHNLVYADIDPPSSQETENALVSIKGLRNLRELRLGEITDVGARRLASFRKLERLNVQTYQASADVLFDSISGMSRLESLDLPTVPLNDDVAMRLSKLPSLRFLAIGYAIETVRESNLSERGLAALGQLTRLEELSLPSVVTPARFQFLARMTSLKILSLDSPNFTDVDLQFLAGLQNLELLTLSYCPIDGTGFRDLRNLTRLREVYLQGTNVGDEAIPLLAALPALTYVDLAETQVTAKGLEQFNRCQSLKHLRADRFVEANQKRLQEALPNCVVEY